MNPLPDVPQPPPAEAEAPPGRWCLFRRHCWFGFRICFRTSYVLLALVAYALVHLNYIGLPGFLKEPLVEQLRARGFELDYSRLRFTLGQGLVADNVNAHVRGDPANRFTYIRRLGLRLDWSPLGQLLAPRVAGVSLEGGEGVYPITGAPGNPAVLLRFTDIAGDLGFPVGDEWQLSWLEARAHGASFTAAGTVTNVSYLLALPRKPGQKQLQGVVLARVVSALDRMQYANPPHVDLHFMVDGADWHRSVAQLRFGAAGVSGEHGTFDGVYLTANVQAAKTGEGQMHGVLRLDSSAARTRWGAFESLRLRADAVFLPTNEWPRRLDWSLAAQSLVRDQEHLATLRINGVTLVTNQLAGSPTSNRPAVTTELTLSAADGRSRWANVTNLLLQARLQTETVDLWPPLAADWNLRAGRMDFRQTTAEGIGLRGSLQRVPVAGSPVLPSAWTNLAPWRMGVGFQVTNLARPHQLLAELAGGELDWREGRLRLTNLDLRLPAGLAAGEAQLEVISRQAEVDLRGHLDPLQMESALSADAWRWVTNSGVRPDDQVSFDFHATGPLPPWDTPATNWLEEMKPGLVVGGTLGATNFSLRDVVFEEIHVPFHLTPDSLRLAGLRLTDGPGELTGEVEAEIRSGRYHARVTSSLDPLAFRSLARLPGLDEQFELIKLAQRPVIEGDLWGDWHDDRRTGARIRVALTNATYRAEPITELRTTLAYTNREIVFTGTELFQGTNEARVPFMRYDMPAQLLYITNGFSTLNVVSLLRAIGPKTARTMAPYHFLAAPTVRINGAIPLVDEVTGSVVFQASLPKFQWWYFEFDHVLATVGWRGNLLSITNVAGGFYGGLMDADVAVNMENRNDAVFNFNATFTDVELRRLLADLTTGTNRLEGELSGQIILREGHGQPDLPWYGVGNAQMRNGYLWDLPLFGLMSPVFNTISPGLGNARFQAGNAIFTITNRDVNFSHIELLSPAMRLQLRGPVDFDGRLNLVLEAEPLRDVPLFGPLVNFVLTPFSKLLEYDLHGTLAKPEAELRHVPSFLLAPLQPFKTLRNIFGGSSSSPKDVIGPTTVRPLPPDSP